MIIYFTEVKLNNLATTPNTLVCLLLYNQRMFVNVIQDFSD